ncbi:MAG: hypothetical protein Q9212_001057 [Teloschistes hypoglaucus]
MFSYLRPNNRRSALPPASTPYSPPVRHVHSLQGSTENFAEHHSYRSTDQTRPSPISPGPPVLPPIPRVASHHESPGKRYVDESVVHADNVRSELAFEDFGSLPTQDERVASSAKLDEQRPAALGPPPVPLQQNLQSPSRQLRPFGASVDSVRLQSEPLPMHAATKPQDQAKRGAKLGHAPAPSTMKLSSAPGASTAQGRQVKTKFNLLNPMSLLARRRSHQAVAEANSEKAQYKHAFPPVPGIPDDFDPRIRGNVVHDFSAPRPGSNTSSSRVRDSDRQREAILYHSRRPSPIPTTSSADDDSPSSGERDHTPQFKEHFDDDLDPLQDGPAKQGMSAFMYHVSLNQSQSEPHRSVLPPFARHLPSTITTAPSTLPISSPHPPRKSLEIVPETHVTDVISTDKSLPSTLPVSPPGKARSRASSNTDSPYQPSGLPKRIKSNASRFSFDMSGVGSATQEQLLEEKHRQNERKRANKRGNTQRSNSRMASEFDDEDNDEDDEEYCDSYDDLGEADGIEEMIPGINADEEELTALNSQYHRQPTDLISPRESFFTSDPSLASTGITSPNTPRENSSKGFGPFILQAQPSLATNEIVHENPRDLVKASEFQENHFDHAVHAHPPTNSIPKIDRPRSYLSQSYEDDMYFDDGMIDDLDEEYGHAFDESVFDDDSSRIYGLPLRDLKPLPDGIARDDQELDRNQATESLTDDPHHLRNAITNLNEESVHDARVSRMSFIPTADMSGHTAYHDALVAGVNQAALNGKFSRSTSLGLAAGSAFDSNAGVILNAGPRFYAGRDTEGLRMDSNFEDADDFDLDDALEDDSIVAAANAEALENDDEGFYGQEFGFFARASGAGEAEYANGGYFGSRGFEGLGRSHSGRNNDSSLTPITERSEWSNRNSAISLTMHGFPPYSAGPQPSPGLAQLVDMMQTVQEFHNPIPPPLRIPGV